MAKAQITSRIQRGPLKGAILVPHKYADGTYVVSSSKHEEDYQRVSSTQEILDALAQGYSLRMSAYDLGTPPSLIEPKAITIIRST